MGCEIICQSCGIEAPTRPIEFHQNIGALVMRFHKTCKGNLCKRCVHRRFWQFTTTNLTLGWWGYISLVMTPVFTVNNIVRYLGALGMPSVPEGAAVPVLTPEAISKLTPHGHGIVARLNQREALDAVARDVAPKAGVTPGQVVKYVVALAAARQQQMQPKTMGFPVQPVNSRASAASGAPIPVEPLPTSLVDKSQVA